MHYNVKPKELTKREQEVKRLYEQGQLSQKQIGILLGISFHTVKNHLTIIRLKEKTLGKPNSSSDKINVLRSVESNPISGGSSRLRGRS